jgi:hypothetical protein
MEIKEPSFMADLRNSELPETAKRFKITVAASMAIDDPKVM